jgi:hypothetical protein
VLPAVFPRAIISAVLVCAVCAPNAAVAAPDSAASTASAAPKAGGDAMHPGTQPAWSVAYARGHWSAAVELLEAIPEGSRTGWHWLHLARAHEKCGQLVEAFATFERLREVASDAPRAPGMKDIAEQGAAEAAAIAGRIPWAEVSLGAPLPPGALVFVDQQWLEPSRMRSPYPVNPGWHTFLIESNGGILAARRVHFEEGQSRLVPLTPAANGASADGSKTQREVAPGAAASGATRSRATASRAASSATRAPTEPAAARSHTLNWHAPEDQPARGQRDGLKTAAFVSLGIGGLGTLIGTGLAISALRARDTSDPPPVPCFSSSNCNGTSAADGWQSQASGAALSYTVGLIGLVTGGILWLGHREYSSAQPTLKIADVELEPRVKANGAALHGRF